MPHPGHRPLLAALVLGLLALALPTRAGEALAAVAANFAEVADALVPGFRAASGHELTIAVGSTGKLYAQIVNGAPFDLLLAADRERPRLLVEAGLAVAGSRFTYAVGRLALWSAAPDAIGPDGGRTLAAGRFRHLALANPKLAPYGAAARQALERLGLWQELRERVVQAENVGQTFAMVATGNAELGFVALSAVLSPRNTLPGSRWEVPAALYQPIRQDAVLLARAARNPAARAFLDYLKAEPARALIRRFGYAVE